MIIVFWWLIPHGVAYLRELDTALRGLPAARARKQHARTLEGLRGADKDHYPEALTLPS